MQGAAMMLLLILAAFSIVGRAVALLGVQLLPLDIDIQSFAHDASHAIGCRFQVVVDSEQEWSNTMQVCIWSEAVASTTFLDAAPTEAQCTHGVVGEAMFPVTAQGTYTINAAIVYDNRRASLLSDVATIIVETTPAASFKEGKPPPVAMRDVQVTFAV
jgi:hypothetical protein